MHFQIGLRPFGLATPALDNNVLTTVPYCNFYGLTDLEKFTSLQIQTMHTFNMRKNEIIEISVLNMTYLI